MRFFNKVHLRRFACAVVLAVSSAWTVHAQAAANHLANTTVLVIRHAEKPDSGSSLSPEGFIRAQKYAQYFHPLLIDGQRLQPDTLYAGADSVGSIRPRLTLEPLRRAIGISLNCIFPTNKPEQLAHALAAEQHGHCILIAWRHKKIAALLKALGADPSTLLPEGTWPDEVYDWVILLHYDAAGHIDQQRRIVEPSPLP